MTSTRKAVLAAAFATFWSTVSYAADQVRGQLILLERCPGDTVEQVAADELAPIFAAILTPVLTGIVTQGMQAWGNKLSEQAKEANVDVVHRGAHFYKYSSEKRELRIAFGCVIAAAKGVREKKGALDAATNAYQALKVSKVEGGPSSHSWSASGSELAAELRSVGFSSELPPSILGVFDIELSDQATEFRLVPRYIAMDHSLRDKRRDSSDRTITFDFLLEHPHAEKPFGNPLVKLDGLVAGQPFSRTSLVESLLASEWVALPPLNETTSQRLGALKVAVDGKMAALATVEDLVWSLSEQERVDSGISAYTAGNRVDCPNQVVARRQWRVNRLQLQAEEAKPAGAQDERVLKLRGAASEFFKACYEFRSHLSAESDSKIGRRGVKAGAFDITVTFREFRERPFAKFFGKVLATDAVSSGISSAVVGAVDPGTRDAASKAEETARTALYEAYEAAVVAAELAIAAYDAAVAAEKPAKAIEMESRKRAANRKAEELRIVPPYPDSGLWF